MSSVVISGDVSGSVTLQAPSAAGSTVLNLPSTIGNTGTSAFATTNASGNLGLGVTPSANEFGNNLQINQTILNDDNGGTNHLSKNAYYSSGWKYITTDFASKYTQSLGTHQWSVAPSGTAGNAITFNNAMTLNASGTLNVSTATGSISKSGAVTSLTMTTGDAYSLSTSLGVLGLDSGATALAIRMNDGGYYLPFSFAKNGAMSVGGATATTSGAGITFPATQQASSDANTLDDYEEGTWTPNQGSGLAVVGAFSSGGRYTKIGRQVFVSGFVAGATSCTVGAQGIITSNLPFTVAASYGTGGGTAVNKDYFTLGIITFPNGTTTNLYAAQAMPASASSGIDFYCTYFV